MGRSTIIVFYNPFGIFFRDLKNKFVDEATARCVHIEIFQVLAEFIIQDCRFLHSPLVCIIYVPFHGLKDCRNLQSNFPAPRRVIHVDF